ncbi:hypothetical protein L5515_006299 [Caenorhabditis briggsae]|uniref:Uncharacterized protein n=1 Tax=Caenorhabditis briggsae TaxID=6238 RepID=A0AAE9F0B6_CAEBR|nr:hypothetical protein L5515_006299 [Caenorhabditis briggsae]
MDQQTDEQIRMNTSAVAITVVGFISSLVTCFTNVILLKTYMKKKNDMALFYYRFTLDVILGALVAPSLLFAVLYSYFSSELSEYQNFIFYLSLPASNVGACRSIVTLSVAIERMVANRLALIDSAMVFMFDFMPSFIANQFSTTQFFSSQNIGPYGTVAKLLGCAIEAFLVYRKMQKGK